MLVHPGWHEVVPGTHTITEIYLALEFGNLDLPVEMSLIEQGQARYLRDLAAIPAHQHSSRLIERGKHTIAGMRSMKVQGDAAHRKAMDNMGKLCFS